MEKLETIFPIEIWRIIYSFDPTYHIKWCNIQEKINNKDVENNDVEVVPERNNNMNEIFLVSRNVLEKIICIIILIPFLFIFGIPLFVYYVFNREKILRQFAW